MQAPAPPDEYITRAKEVLSIPRIRRTSIFPLFPTRFPTNLATFIPPPTFFTLPLHLILSNTHSPSLSRYSSLLLSLCFFFFLSLPTNSCLPSLFRSPISPYPPSVFFICCLFVLLSFSFASEYLFVLLPLAPGATYSHVPHQTNRIMGAVRCNWLGWTTNRLNLIFPFPRPSYLSRNTHATGRRSLDVKSILILRGVVNGRRETEPCIASWHVHLSRVSRRRSI